MATESCDYKLAADLVADCEQTSIMGLRNTGYIINTDDIDFDSCERDDDNPCIIKTLALTTGARAYRVYVPGKTPFTGTTKEIATGTYRNKFTKSVSLVILDNGPDVVNDIINPLANGSFVVILENKYTGADGKNTFEIYGYEQGMTATALTDEKYSEDTDGGWAATLEESDALYAGLFLYNTDLSTTRAALESLVAGS